MHRALGQHSNHGLPLGLLRRLLQHSQGVFPDEAPTVDAMPTLELRKRFVRAPIEQAGRVLAAAFEKAFALEPGLCGDDGLNLGRHGPVFLDLLPLVGVRGVRAGYLIEAFDLGTLDERGHLRLEELIARKATCGAAALLIGEKSFELLKGHQVELLGALQRADLREALPQQRQIRQDAVELEVLVLLGAIPVTVVRKLTSRQCQIGRTVLARLRDLVSRSLGENVWGPVFAEIEQKVTVFIGRGGIDLALCFAVLPESHRRLQHAPVHFPRCERPSAQAWPRFRPER